MSPLPSFAINGRFLSQPQTGVQRYAMNVIDALNTSISGSGAVVPLIAPLSATDPGLSNTPLIQAGPLKGHLWEQTVLPVRWPGRLLNLCNTAPAVKTDQIVCIHDANIFVAPESYSRAFRTIYRVLQQSLANRVKITTVSAHSAQQLARHLPVRASDITVLPNGHEHALAWDPALARIAPAVVAASGERSFAFAVGSRARHKNVKLLLEAAPEFDAMGLDIIIVGGTADVFASDTLRFAPNVKMVGYVTDHDIAYLMDQALCLLFPSWTEGFGLPIIEAMARGCPVISSDRASMPEVCGDAALMAAPDDPAAWVRHVRALVNSQELRQDLIGRGNERVQRFSWKEAAAGYLEVMYQTRACASPAKAAPESIEMSQTMPKVAVVIATLGRRDVLKLTVEHLLATQVLKPAIVVVSCVVPEDADDVAPLPSVRIVTGPRGSAAQRNSALDVLPPDIDVVVFFDDDFVADAEWLAIAARTFRDEPDVVAFTGRVVADDIKGPGLSFSEAVRILNSADRSASWSRIEPFSPYGCNMAFRLSAIGDLRFDERLVLYGWLEDRDFAGGLAKRGGRQIKCATACGVHMGVKGGRVAGERVGYSQVVNPLYMLRKGTMTIGQVFGQMFRNISSNVAGALRPEPYIDRRGRLKGNLRGFVDVLRGHLEPERAADIPLGVRK